MLLSRVADALYWLTRYLERAEHTARLVDVALDLRLGRSADDGALQLYGLVLPAGVSLNPRSLTEAAFFDSANPSSVTSCVIAARENARQVRDEISSEMWEQLNALFLRLRQMRDDPARASRSNDAARVVLEGAYLFAGVTDATMGHGEGWYYLQAGRFLERAVTTARLLDTFFTDESGPVAMPPLDRADWVALLRSCAALEGYCRQYTADVRPERVTEFLLLNAECPRSVRFAAARVEDALQGLARHSGRRSGRAERLAGRLRSSLDYAQVDEVLSEGPHAYFAGLGRQCGQLHAALYQGYISYAVESALPA
ncbi:MAG TPA: alpha-E domain-containing protein [Vicinamibacterales bacterium]|nr:alpha-E domain-containing protein [Vicinamibacterales bacterium]